MKLIYDDESNRFFADVYQKAKNSVSGKALVGMDSQVIGSKILGDTLESTDLVQLGFTLQPDFFSRHYQDIFAALKSAGTFESYVTLIRALLGEKTEVTFEIPKAGHLKINVIEEVELRGLMTKQNDGGGMIDDTQPRGVLIATATSHWAIQQILLALQNLQPNGIFVEYNLVADS
jgi:hypothetical protein